MGRKLSGDRPASSTHPSPSPADYCPKMLGKPTAYTITPRRKTRTGTFVHALNLHLLQWEASTEKGAILETLYTCS